jgi:transcriptional regulator with XRE-family HTH domain
MSQRELADHASVPTTMISAYERDKRQPTLATLMRLLNAAGFDLTMKLAPRDAHDEVLAHLESTRSLDERRRRDRQIEAWRRARPVDAATCVEVSVADLDDVIRSKEAAGRPKDVQVLPALYRHRQSR